MLMPLDYLVEKYKLKINGILHIGGSQAEEYESYMKEGIENQIWIEAIPEVYQKMVKKLEPNSKAIPINACVSDVSNQEVMFYITNNEQSSSFLELKEHKISHPDVTVVKTIKLKTITVVDIVKNLNIDLSNYNFLNIDIQGAELFALKGMKDLLNKIDYAYLEVNVKELYAGCALLSEIDEYLKEFGFKRIEIKLYDNLGWGDAFYLKEKSLFI
jgi:FkbM family methyltransferase